MIKQLMEKIAKTKAPICVGLDPMLSYIPEQITKKAFEEHGETLAGAAEAVWAFNKEIIDVTCDLIPSVKPQIAMYEQFGLEGLAVYKRTVDYCREKGLVVIGDAKRGDIGSTSAAYAAGHIGQVKVGSKVYSGFRTDFLTVNPYLGTDGIKPFVDVCKEQDKGLFVLVKTSNPSIGEFQDRLIELMPRTFFLVPGYGAQGGTAEDLKYCFNDDGFGAVVNSSRGIIAAYKKEAYAKFGSEHFGEASRQAVLDMIADIGRVL